MAHEIPLTQGYKALVSDTDYPWLSRHKWRYANGYAARTVRRDGRPQIEYMHRVILGAETGQLVDHRDGNPLNNVRDNLRIATSAQNQHNKGVSVHSKTGMKGVGPWRGRFHARIRVQGRKIHLGYWPDLETAALIYDAAARRFHGDFAHLNFPECPVLPAFEVLLDQVLSGLHPSRRAKKASSLGFSPYRGVYSERGKWRAKISVAGKAIHLGYFDDELSAAHAYDLAAHQYHGDKATLNFPGLALSP